VHRKATRAEKIRLALEMPRLRRSDRNQRLGIVVVILLAGVYFLVLRPLADLLLPQTRAKKTQPAAAPGKGGLQPKKR